MNALNVATSNMSNATHMSDAMTRIAHVKLLKPFPGINAKKGDVIDMPVCFSMFYKPSVEDVNALVDTKLWIRHKDRGHGKDIDYSFKAGEDFEVTNMRTVIDFLGCPNELHYA